VLRSRRQYSQDSTPEPQSRAPNVRSGSDQQEILFARIGECCVHCRGVPRIVEADRLVVVREAPTVRTEAEEQKPGRAFADHLVSKGPDRRRFSGLKVCREADVVNPQRRQLDLGDRPNRLEELGEASATGGSQLDARPLEPDESSIAQPLQLDPHRHLRQARPKPQPPSTETRMTDVVRKLQCGDRFLHADLLEQKSHFSGFDRSYPKRARTGLSGYGLDLHCVFSYIGAMGHVDSDPSLSASVKPGGIADALRIVCERDGHCRLQDGTEVCLRLVESTDVPACSVMLSECSPKSLYSRYERVVNEPPSELASHLCCPDLRTELAVVAEVCVNDQLLLIGVAQLLADPSHEAAEYAVLVADPWQSRGLGSAFTDCCLRLARAWGVGRVVAEFLPGNMRIIRILERRAFDLYRDMQEHVVSGQKLIVDGCTDVLREAPSGPSWRDP
jgi:GNAT superfamily N-acetyltransferase